MDRSHQQQQLFSASKPPESFYIHMQRLLATKGGGGKHEKKRRFNDDQIRLLETMFQTQTKLEPKQKLELARELGLQPRQVSIWFQNKRARWKSKQLEKEYGVLKSNYDGLVKSMECLKKENQFLTNQLEKLKEMLEQQSDKSTTEQDQSQSHSQSQSQREELCESVRQDQSCCDDHMLYLEGNDTGCIGLAGQGNHVIVSDLELGLELDAEYGVGAYHDQFCTASNVELWDHWPLAELNSVA